MSIQTSNVHKVYRANGVIVNALSGIDLTIREGEFVAVMGPSGCGKSTLLHILGGLDNPTTGEVYIGQHRIDNLSEARRAVLRRNLIGFVFQRFNLIQNLTVADNIELPALMAGMSASDAAKKRRKLLDSLGIADKAMVLPAQLSGGQQQRVALARALVNVPMILLADEPTGNLDSTSTSEVLALLKNFHATGQTILMVTHDARVASIADRIIRMRDGAIVEDSVLDAQADLNVAEMFSLEA